MSSSTGARRKLSRIWVQLGCNKTSRGFLKAPRVAIGAVKLQLSVVNFLLPAAEGAEATKVGTDNTPDNGRSRPVGMPGNSY